MQLVATHFALAPHSASVEQPELVFRMQAENINKLEAQTLTKKRPERSGGYAMVIFGAN
jgi:hypothetical protein